MRRSVICNVLAELCLQYTLRTLKGSTVLNRDLQYPRLHQPCSASRAHHPNTANQMSLKDSEQDSSSALENAQAALSQLTFHLTVQKTATEHAAALAEEVRKQLYHATPAPLPSHLPICPIDLEPIERGDARVLACGHVYHAECIEHWLDFSNTCPLDRSIVEE